MNFRKTLLTLLLSIIFVSIEGAFTQPLDAQSTVANPPFYHQYNHWADSVLNTMTLREKIEQLFMVAAYSNRDSSETIHIDSLISKYHVGGLIFFQGGPYRQANLTNHYQAESKIPLMIGIDAEWGLAMRLDSTVKYPYQMTLGALQNDSLIYQMGQQIGKQCKRIGINIDFAPDIDINTDPKNPIIGARSFGENKHNVAEKGTAYMAGLQSENVMATGKHFPGHGDTKKDSHKTLPIVNFPYSRLDTLELYPFKQLAKKGLASIMVAHLFVPALDSTPNTATSLSPKVVTGLLKDSIGFKGLVITDALNMKGVSAYYPPGVVNLKAFLAGNDVLLFPEDVAQAIQIIQNAVDSEKVTVDDLNKRCKRILEAKAWMGLNHWKPIDTTNLYQDMHKPQYEELKKKLFYKSLTLLSNKNNILPLHTYDTEKIATLAIGADTTTIFQKTINKYIKTDAFFTDSVTLKNETRLLDTLRKYDLVIVSIHRSSANPWKKYTISKEEKNFCRLLEIGTKIKIILAAFCNPYALMDMPAVYSANAVLETYENNYFTQRAAAQALFGAIPVNGKLSVSISDTFPQGSGINLKKVNDVLGYGIPQDVGINPADLDSIGIIANLGIKAKAYPGVQILVAKNGKVIYDKQFGYFTYDSTRKVRPTDIYDMASVTKVAATTASLMKLQGQGEFSLDNGKLKNYIPKLVKGTPYAKLKVKEILAHQARLKPWIPFYLKTLTDGKPNPKIYHDTSSPAYPTRVANHLYIKKGYSKKIYQTIVQTPLRKKREYLYSDLGFYLFKKVIEKETSTPLNQYVWDNFYKPMGMWHTGYLPREWASIQDIAPSEIDNYFRHQTLRGDVNDEGAAMLGGVSGHAGLFSNADDMAKLMQMYLQSGHYDGKKYLDSAVLAQYTKCQYCDNDNRRGAGFDKPVRDSSNGPTCNCISYKSFGHTGFTGTMVWADPDKKVVYIFISNRAYPSRKNWKYIKMNIRTRIQKVIYDAIDKSE